MNQDDVDRLLYEQLNLRIELRDQLGALNEHLRRATRALIAIAEALDPNLRDGDGR